MIEVQILIPVADNSGQPYPPSYHVDFEAELLRLFGASSREAGTVAGQWTDAAGTVYRDESRVYVVGLPSLTDGGKVREAVAFAKTNYGPGDLRPVSGAQRGVVSPGPRGRPRPAPPFIPPPTGDDMNTYQLSSGETLSYPDPPAPVAAYLAQARAAAADPAVTPAELIALVYSPDNPLLDTTILPGRGMVTKAVLDHPVYHVLADLVFLKECAARGRSPDASYAAFTLSVAEAAARLGITPAAVRAAITGRKLAAVLKNGQWWVHPNSVASYRVSNRGPKRVATAKTATTTADPVRVILGSEAGRSLAVRVEGGELVRDGKAGGRVEGHLSPGWTRALVRTTARPGGTRVVVIEPAAGEENAIDHGGLSVRGPFRVVRKVNNPKAAAAAWRAAAAEDVEETEEVNQG